MPTLFRHPCLNLREDQSLSAQLAKLQKDSLSVGFFDAMDFLHCVYDGLKFVILI